MSQQGEAVDPIIVGETITFYRYNILVIPKDTRIESLLFRGMYLERSLDEYGLQINIKTRLSEELVNLGKLTNRRMNESEEGLEVTVTICETEVTDVSDLLKRFHDDFTSDDSLRLYKKTPTKGEYVEYLPQI